MIPKPKAHLLNVKPYVAGKREAQAGEPVKLSSNENPYGPSPKAIAAYEAASSEMHRYGDSHAVALREAIGEVHNLTMDRLVCGSGSDELISLIINSYAGEDDEVLSTKHAFAMYRIYTQVAGASFVEAPEKNLRTDVDALLACVTERTKIVFLANPNNPTGTHIPPEEVKRLRDGLPAHVILALDGAYAELVDAPDYTDGRELVTDSENTVMLRTFSKVYGLPALRLGWMYGPESIIDIMNRARSPFNLNSAAQAAGIAAVRDQEFLRDQVQKNSAQRAWLSGELSTMGYEVLPSQGNFILVKFPDASAMNQYLLKQNIIVREMAGYYLPDYLRISIGTETENKMLRDAIARYQETSHVADAV